MPTTRPPERLPTYQLHKASGQARVTLNGRDLYLGAHGSAESRERYDALVLEWLEAGRDVRRMRRFASDRELTITELVDRYRVWCESYYVKRGRPTQTLHNIKNAVRVLRRAYGSLPVSGFGPAKLKTLREGWVREGLALRTVNYKTQWVKHCFKWGVEEELVPPSVLHGLQAVRGLKPGRCAARVPEPVRPVEDATIEATLPHLPPVVADMVRLQRLIGCRSGELCRMRACELETGGDVWTWRPGEHKTEHLGKDKAYPVGPRAQRILERYLATDLDRPLFSPRRSEQERGERRRSGRATPRTPSQDARDRRRAEEAPSRSRPPGDRYTPSSYRRAVARGCEKAGIEPWTPHRLRHSRATEIRVLFGLDGAAAVLGNSIEAAAIYAERSAATARSIALRTG